MSWQCFELLLVISAVALKSNTFWIQRVYPIAVDYRYPDFRSSMQIKRALKFDERCIYSRCVRELLELETGLWQTSACLFCHPGMCSEKVS